MKTITVLEDRRDAVWLARAIGRDLGLQCQVESTASDRHVLKANYQQSQNAVDFYVMGFKAAAGFEQTSDTNERETR